MCAVYWGPAFGVSSVWGVIISALEDIISAFGGYTISALGDVLYVGEGIPSVHWGDLCGRISSVHLGYSTTILKSLQCTDDVFYADEETYIHDPSITNQIL